MVIDHIRNRHLYYGLGEDYKTALDFLAQYSDATPKEDDIVVNEDILVRVRPCNTKLIENCPFESHRDYVELKSK